MVSCGPELEIKKTDHKMGLEDTDEIATVANSWTGQGGCRKCGMTFREGMFEWCLVFVNLLMFNTVARLSVR